MSSQRTSLVSVVITAYNAEKHIAETLESVLAQTYSPLEVIVVDDGSSDGTANIVKERFSTVRYFYQPNAGQPVARNTGIKKAAGEYIAFVDSDDLWLPQKTEKQINKLEKSSAAWCYCDCLYFRDSLDHVLYRYSSLMRPHEGAVLQPLLLGNFVSSPTAIVRKDVLLDLGLWDETRAIAEDWNMWLKIASRFRVAYVEEPLAAYRSHATSMLGGASVTSVLEANLAVLENGLGYLPDDAPRLAARARANIYFKVGLTYLKRGQEQEGQRMIAEALRNDPLQWRLYGYRLASLLPARFVQTLNVCRHAYCRAVKPVSR